MRVSLVLRILHLFINLHPFLELLHLSLFQHLHEGPYLEIGEASLNSYQLQQVEKLLSIFMKRKQLKWEQRDQVLQHITSKVSLEDQA